MKHAGKARKAGFKLIVASFVILAVLLLGGLVASLLGSIVMALAGILVFLWILFSLFCLNFFRDPTPRVPSDPKAIVSPAHGKVDVVDETIEPDFMGGGCKRVSIFLSVLDVHVQNAPIAGRAALLKHCPGRFLNAMNTDCGKFNENLMIGFDSAECPGEKVGVRLIAGLLARRIVPWILTGEVMAKGDRISLIQFGSRVDLYLPLTAEIVIKAGDRVRGGETIVATRK